MNHRRIVQIAVGTNNKDRAEDHFRERLYALAFDGSLWRLDDSDLCDGRSGPGQWKRLPELPRPAEGATEVQPTLKNDENPPEGAVAMSTSDKDLR